jgi:hypothetical protein
MTINTPTLKKCINKKVRYKTKGSNLWNYDVILEVVRKNIIFNNDSRTFSQISVIELVNTKQ